MNISDAYDIIKDDLDEAHEYVSCNEYEDFFVFCDRFRAADDFTNVGGGYNGVRKSDGRKCVVSLCLDSFCLEAWEAALNRKICKNIGNPIKVYSPEEFRRMFGGKAC